MNLAQCRFGKYTWTRRDFWDICWRKEESCEANVSLFTGLNITIVTSIIYTQYFNKIIKSN